MDNFSKEKVFSDIFARYYVYIFQRALIDVKDQDGAMDISQEVFTRFIPVMDNVRCVKSWLIGTEKNVVMEYFRKWRATDVTVDESLCDTRVMKEDSVREWRMIIKDLIGDSTIFEDDIDLELFYSVVVENKPIRSAGAALNISENQARYRYRIIRKKIQMNLREKGLYSIDDIL